jgi:hypothetical protein
MMEKVPVRHKPVFHFTMQLLEHMPVSAKSSPQCLHLFLKAA